MTKENLSNDTDINENIGEDMKAIIDCPYLESKCSDITCPCPKFKAYEQAKNPQIVKETLEELNIDLNKDPFDVMLSMQTIFASRFHTNKLSKSDIDHWVNDYLVCIEDEIIELLEQIPGDQTGIDLTKNVELKKEVIDILHFTMDLFIAGGYSFEEIKSSLLKRNANNVIETNDILKIVGDLIHKNRASKENIVKECIRFLTCNKRIREQISWKHWKKPNETINSEKLLEAMLGSLESLIRLFNMLFENIDEVKNTYISKNVENILRQKNGY